MTDNVSPLGGQTVEEYLGQSSQSTTQRYLSGRLMGVAVPILYISATLEWAAAQWYLTLDRLNFMLNTSVLLAHAIPTVADRLTIGTT